MPAIPPPPTKDLPQRFVSWLEQLRNILRAVPTVIEGTGTPEGVVTAGRGTRFFRTDGASGTFLYLKTTTSGNTGWVAYG